MNILINPYLSKEKFDKLKNFCSIVNSINDGSNLEQKLDILNDLFSTCLEEFRIDLVLEKANKKLILRTDLIYAELLAVLPNYIPEGYNFYLHSQY